MVGGDDAAAGRARQILDPMAGRVVITGGPGTGQAAKMVNNLIFAVCLAGTCEGLMLAENLGLDPAIFYEIAISSTSDNFALRNWYPAPDVVSTRPSSNGYRPGFMTALMLKDLGIALEAAAATSQTAMDTTQVVHQPFRASFA